MPEQQPNWRFCQKCVGMFFDGRPDKGRCPVGGGHEAFGFNFALPHDVPETPGTQHNWRFCQKCAGMFFDGRPDKGSCPAGGAHQASGFNFVLPHDVPETPGTQHNWRFCHKCVGLFFDGRPGKGRCPGGGAHEASGFNFVLAHNEDIRPGGQNGGRVFGQMINGPLIRGVLLAGGFRTQHELNVMSPADQRNTLIVEMAGRTNQHLAHFQAMNDFVLAGAGAVYVFLRQGRIRTEEELRTISDDDQRNILIVELDSQTGGSLRSLLQGFNNIELVLLGLGDTAPGDLNQPSFIRGVLLAGQFRTQHELNRMSADDQRNTLIVEMAGRTNQPVPHFQAMNDFVLGGVGAVYVFLRQARIRTEPQLKTISDDDQRNIMIVEIDGQTHVGSVLQGHRNMDLVSLGLGVDPAIILKALPGPLQVPPDLFAVEEAFFNSEILTPTGTPLGGMINLTLRSNGSYKVHFHLHDSGLPNFAFQVRAIFVAANGVSLVAQHSGSVEGTVSTVPLFHEPVRDNDHTEEGENPAIQMNWPEIKAGRLWVTKDYSATGAIGFFEDLAKGVLDVGAGAAGGALGVIIGLGAEIGQAFGDLGLGGTFGVIGGVVVFALGGSVVLAVVAGVAAGKVTNALIQQRPLSAQEAQFAADNVFGNSLPADRIVLTNLSGLGGRAFTMPGVDNKIFINLGDAFDKPNPLEYTNPSYPRKGQLLIHELTHAWQIAHTGFLPGLVCEGIVNQANDMVGGSVYVYGPPGPNFSRGFNLEQQAAIVDQWFNGTRTAVVPLRNAMDKNDPYFVYIRDNIQPGRG